MAIAEEHGHEFTADKIAGLSEEELEGVAGGIGAGFSTDGMNIWACIIYNND